MKTLYYNERDRNSQKKSSNRYLIASNRVLFDSCATRFKYQYLVIDSDFAKRNHCLNWKMQFCHVLVNSFKRVG